MRKLQSLIYDRLIAILLGRLRLPIDQAIGAYIRLSGKAFTMRNLLSRTGRKVTLGAKFKTGPLEDAIHEMIGDDSETKLLKEETSEGGRPCKVQALDFTLFTAISRLTRGDS